MEKLDKKATQRYGIKVFRRKDERSAAEDKTELGKEKPAVKEKRRDA